VVPNKQHNVLVYLSLSLEFTNQGFGVRVRDTNNFIFKLAFSTLFGLQVQFYFLAKKKGSVLSDHILMYPSPRKNNTMILAT
jgi:hypothetical protein